jgi:TPR repeat protein
VPNGFRAPLPPSAPTAPEPPSLDTGLSPLDLPRTVRREQSRALVPVQQRASAGVNPWVFVIATGANTLIAAVLAVVITLGVARRDQPPAAEPEKAAALARSAPEAQPEPAAYRPVELFPIGSPAEPLRLEALKPAHLPLQVRPEEAVEDSYILLLSGLPPNAALSGASRMGADSWLVPPGALQRIEILVPEWSPSVLEVGMELRRTNGAVAAQSKLWLAIPPPPQPAGASLDEDAIKDLVRTGDRLLGRGDVAAARALYERAAVMGSAQAALSLGATYDPRRLLSLGVFGMVGNKDRARAWYQRADELGHPEAKARIAALQER